MAKNPFRNKMMCDQYDACLQAYRNGLSGLFTPEGNPHRGSAIALAFWNAAGKDRCRLFVPKEAVTLRLRLRN